MSLNHSLYKLADVLGMTIDRHGSKYSGKVVKSVDVGGLRVKVPLEIVSVVASDEGIAVLVKCLADVGLFVTVRSSNQEVIVHVLDLSKVVRVKDMFEKSKAGDFAEALAELHHAEVKVFRLGADATDWEEIR